MVPFLISMILAYLLHPLVDGLMKCRMNRLTAILVLYLFFIGVFGLLGWYGIPFIAKQAKELMTQLPFIQEQALFIFSMMDHHIERLPDGLHYGIDDVIGNMEEGLRKAITGMVQGIGSLFGHFFSLVVIPFIVFYLLYDVEVIQKTLYYFVPKKHRKTSVKLWKDIDHSLGEYIRGQITVGFIVGILAFIGYYFVGLSYPLFLATFVGITNIIPYFGPYIGAAPALIIAFITEPKILIWVILINFSIQILEGNVIAPWIVGKRLHIHPIFIIFALLIGAEMGGILGMIMAVPIFVVIKVIFLHTVLHIRQYRIDRVKQE
jgi:predicted PurR-regulated permease PerM